MHQLLLQPNVLGVCNPLWVCDFPEDIPLFEVLLAFLLS